MIDRKYAKEEAQNYLKAFFLDDFYDYPCAWQAFTKSAKPDLLSVEYQSEKIPNYARIYQSV